MLQRLNLKWKVLAIIATGPLVIAVIFSWYRVGDIRNGAENAIVAKSEAIVLMAEATRQEMSKKRESGIMRPFDEIDESKVLQAVPVITAINTAAINAQKATCPRPFP